MDKLTRTTLVIRSPGLLATDMGGEIVMMSIEQGHYYGLNGVASRTWEMLRQPLTVDAICRQIEAEYAVSPAECEHAMLAFLSDLARHDLISAA